MSTARPNGRVQQRRDAAHLEQRHRRAGHGQRDDARERQRREAQQQRGQQPRAVGGHQPARGGGDDEQRHHQASDPRAHRQRRARGPAARSAATGCSVLAWPASAGEIARNATGTASAAIVAPLGAGDGRVAVGADGDGAQHGDRARPRSRHEHGAQQQPRAAAQRPDEPEAGAQHLAHDARIERRPERRARRGRPLKDDAGEPEDEAQAHGDGEQDAGAARERGGGGGPFGPRAGRRRQGRAPDGQQEDEPAEAEGDGQVGRCRGRFRRRSR